MDVYIDIFLLQYNIYLYSTFPLTQPHPSLLQWILRYIKCCIWFWPIQGTLKGSPKNENSVINYSPSCCSKPVRPLFIFGTQIKIFLLKSESFLTLYRQQHNYHVQGPESGSILMKLWEYFLYTRKTKITTLFNNLFSSVSGTQKRLTATSLFAPFTNVNQWMEDAVIGVVFFVCHGFRDNGDGM